MRTSKWGEDVNKMSGKCTTRQLNGKFAMEISRKRFCVSYIRYFTKEEIFHRSVFLFFYLLTSKLNFCKGNFFNYYSFSMSQ